MRTTAIDHHEHGRASRGRDRRGAHEGEPQPGKRVVGPFGAFEPEASIAVRRDEHHLGA